MVSNLEPRSQVSQAHAVLSACMYSVLATPTATKYLLPASATLPPELLGLPGPRGPRPLLEASPTGA